jgi:hypothetical protein
MRARDKPNACVVTRFLLVMGLVLFLPAAAPAPPLIEGTLLCTQTDSMTIVLEWTIEDVQGIEAVRFLRGVNPNENPILLMDVVLPPEPTGAFDDTDVWAPAWFRYYLFPELSIGGHALVTDGACDVFTEPSPVDRSTWGTIKALYR